MTRARSLRLASLAFTALTFGSVLVAAPTTASADRVRIRVGGGGSVRVRGHAHVHIGGPVYGPGYRYGRPTYRPHFRPYYRPRIYVRAYPRPYYYYYPGFYGWGYRYAAPPPPPCYAECGPPSAYYYGGQQPAAVAAVRVQREPLPRLGLGIFGGAVGVEGNDAGSDLGLIGRIRATDHLVLEAELSKTEIDSGARVDRRLGGALLFDLSPYARLSPFLLVGGGFGQTDVDDGTFTAEQAYGEVGIGLEWRLTRHLALFGDLRAGVRETNASDEELLLVRGGGDVGPRVDDNERFTRARLGALLYF